MEIFKKEKMIKQNEVDVNDDNDCQNSKPEELIESNFNDNSDDVICGNEMAVSKSNSQNNSLSEEEQEIIDI